MAMLAVLLAFSLTLVLGCDNGGGGGGDDDDDPTGGPTDGGTGSVTWTKVASNPFPTNDRINGVAYGADKFVAVGNASNIAYSTDGVTWTAVTTSPFGTDDIVGVTYGDSKFVAVGASKAATSPDGETWTIVSPAPGGNVTGIAFGDGVFMGVGPNGGMRYSADFSAVWTTVSGLTGTNGIFGNSNSINAVAYGGGKFFAGGQNGRSALVTYDATTETGTSAVSNIDAAFTSTQFKTSQFTVAKTVQSATYGGGKFVAVGFEGNIAYSTDGVTWTKATPPGTFGTGQQTQNIMAVAYGGGKFIVGTGYTNGKMATSADGVTWTAVTDSAFGANGIHGFAYGAKKFVAVGTNGTIAYSNDQE